MLRQLIDAYYYRRALSWPDTSEALLWALTELGEVCEVILQQKGGWKRNDPSKEEKLSRDMFDDRLAEELGDVIMMVQVAGQTQGLDPLGALVEKMTETLWEAGFSQGVREEQMGEDE